MRVEVKVLESGSEPGVSVAARSRIGGAEADKPRTD